MLIYQLIFKNTLTIKLDLMRDKKLHLLFRSCLFMAWKTLLNIVIFSLQAQE